jgi:hypothetical protein
LFEVLIISSLFNNKKFCFGVDGFGVEGLGVAGLDMFENITFSLLEGDKLSTIFVDSLKI